MADEEVKVHDEEDSDISASIKQGVCFFCHRQFSKYTCPRCNAGYCSSTCYKSEKHLQCSEGFYRESVVQELSSRARDPKDVDSVLRMLKTLEEQDQDLEESDVPPLEERFADINLNTADVDVIWDALTPDEKKEFEASVRTGSLSHLIKEWIPWWQQDGCDQRSNKADIKVIRSSDSQKNLSSLQQSSKPKQTSSYPKVLQKIPPMPGSVNPLIKYSIIDVLYSYAYVMRLYNGSLEENLHHSGLTLYELASSLSQNLNFESLEMVVHNSLNVVLEKKDVWNSQEFSYNSLLDVCQLMSGSYTVDERNISFIDCALSDVCRLFARLKKALKNEMESESEDAKKMFLAKKKVEFFLSWKQSNNSILSSMGPELKAIHFKLISNWKIHSNEKRKIHVKLKRKGVTSCNKLIEEL